MKLVLATGNPHKVEEMTDLMAGLEALTVTGAGVVGGMPEVEETELTFSGNATLKAMAVFRLLKEAAWVCADDSGLAVDALDGRPGVFSARYAGLGATDLANMEQVLNEMSAVPEEQRTAAFVCCLALVNPAGKVMLFEERCEGTLLREPRGTAGFGYDPIFVPNGYNESFGQLGEAVKGRLSHRARAVGALREWLFVNG